MIFEEATQTRSVYTKKRVQTQIPTHARHTTHYWYAPHNWKVASVRSVFLTVWAMLRNVLVMFLKRYFLFIQAAIS